MKLQITLTGTTPLIVQSPHLLDPWHEITKQLRELTSKPSRNRTEEDLLDMARLEFYGSLYYAKQLGPYIPGANVLASLRDGAKRAKAGKKLLSALSVQALELPLQYEGPREIDKLWQLTKFRFTRPVRNIGGGSVMRCRPIFRSWGLVAEGDLDTNEMDFDQLVRVAAVAGRFAGLGAWRPSSPKGGQYGRYTAEVDKL